MRKFKYVIADNIPILFFMGTEHKDVARGFKVTSAGFCDVWYDEMLKVWKTKCYGESISLNMKSDPVEDTMLLEHVLNSEHY